MPRSRTVTVTLSDALAARCAKKATKIGWPASRQLRAMVEEYLENPTLTRAQEKALWRQLLQARTEANAARRAWRKDVWSSKPSPHPTSTIVVSLLAGTMQRLRQRASERPDGTMAGEVRLIIEALLNGAPQPETMEAPEPSTAPASLL